MTMGNRIESAMNQANVNQTELAKILGVTPQAVQQWVRGGTEPKGKRLMAIALALNTNVDWLVTGKEPNLTRSEIPPVESNALIEQRPPIIEEQEWKALLPKTRALVEELITKTSSGTLKDSHISALQTMVDALSKENDD